MKQLDAGLGSGRSITVFFKTYRFQLLLLLACLIGYFEITFFIFIPKWDNIDGFLPYRHVVGTWISDGYFPLWNPYQLLGSPIHSDPQSGAWYPVVWLLSLINDYDIYAINIELSFHFFIGGLGMFLLGKTLKIKDTIAFVMGLAYMFSGFMVGTSQILVMIIAAAWLPLSINYLLISLNKPTFRHLFTLAFINFLLVTGSYPAMTIILFYIYLLIAGYFLYRSFKNQFSLKKVLVVFVAQTVLLLLLTGGYFYSIYEMMPYLSRGKGIPYTADLFLKVGFPIQAFLSFILPYSTTANTEFFNSDGSMINGYFGLFSIVFIIYGLVFYRKKKLIITLLVGVFIILIATGMQLPIHYYLYKFLPGFNLFRHPSIFRVYAIFLFILAFGFSLDAYRKDSDRFKHIRPVLLGVMVFFLIVVIIAAFRTDYSIMPDFLEALLSFKEKSPLNLSGHLLIQGLIQLLFVTIAFLLAKREKLNLKSIALLVFLDLFLATQLNAPRTLFYSVNFKEPQKYFEAKPHQLTNQTLADKIIDINNKSVKPKQRGLWKNLNSFAKRTAYDGYNPVKFNDFLTLRKSEIMKPVLNNPLLYIPDELLVYPLNKKITEGSGKAFLSEDMFSEFGRRLSSGKLSDLKLEYNGFFVKSDIKAEGLVFVNQNYHHNWHAYVDNKEVNIIKANIGLMAFIIPAGIHKVELKYRSPGAIIGLYISLLTMLIGFSVILFQGLTRIIHKKEASIKDTPLSYH